MEHRTVSNSKIIGMLAIGIMLMASISSAFNQIGIGSVILFIIYQLFVILMPGLLIVALLKMPYFSFLETLALSYITGYSFNIFVYVALMLLNHGSVKALIICYFVIDAVAVAFLIIKKGNIDILKYQETSREEVKILVTIMLLLFFIKLIVFSLNENSLYRYGYEIYQQDFLTWVADVASCKISIPEISPGDGLSIRKYHYLVAAQLACVSKICGTSAIVTTNSFSFIESTIMMALAGCSVTFRLIKSNVFRWITPIILFFTTGIESLSVASYQWHILTMPMGFDVGYAFMIIIVLYVVDIYTRNDVNVKDMALLSFLIGILTGVKGPCAAIALLLMGFTGLYMLTQKQKLYKMVAFVLFPAICFIAVYALMMMGATSNFNTTTTASGINLWQRYSGFVGRFFMSMPHATIPMTIYLAYLFVNKKRNRLIEILALTYLGGVLITTNVSMYGLSEMYFIMSVICLPVFAAGIIMDGWICNRNIDSRGMWIIALTIVVLVTYSFSANPYYLDMSSDTYKRLVSGVKGLFALDSEADTEHPVYTSEEYYNACIWVRDNTPQGSRVVASNANYDPQFTALSERLKVGDFSTDTITSAISGDDDVLASIEALPAQYVIGYYYNEDVRDLACVYASEHIYIYMINR